MSLSNLSLSVLSHLYRISLFTGGPYMTNYVLQIRHYVFIFMFYLLILRGIRYSGISVIQITLYVFASTLNIISLFFYFLFLLYKFVGWNGNPSDLIKVSSDLNTEPSGVS